jgi:hypothetical protein
MNDAWPRTELRQNRVSPHLVFLIADECQGRSEQLNPGVVWTPQTQAKPESAPAN